MKKDELDGIGKIKIYKGVVHKLYADDFSLVRSRPVGTKKEDKGKVAYFYINSNGQDVCIDHGKVLPDRKEAVKQCDAAIQKNAATLINALSGRVKDPKEQHRILDAVKKDTESLYYDKNELKFDQEMPKKKLKQMIETRNNKQNKNKK